MLDFKNDDRHYSGEICKKTGLYGQYSDSSGAYAGSAYDRHVRQGDRFPPSLNNRHFRLKR